MLDFEAIKQGFEKSTSFLPISNSTTTLVSMKQSTMVSFLKSLLFKLTICFLYGAMPVYTPAH